MSEFMQFYLTQFNSIGVAVILIIVLIVLSVIPISKDMYRLSCILFSMIIITFFATILILSSSHYEVESSAKWRQIYPTKDENSKISLKFENAMMSQSIDSNVGLEPLQEIRNYQNKKLVSIKTVKVIAETKSVKEEREFYLSRNNLLPKEMNADNIVIDKIEYREID